MNYSGCYGIAGPLSLAEHINKEPNSMLHNVDREKLINTFIKVTGYDGSIDFLKLLYIEADSLIEKREKMLWRTVLIATLLDVKRGDVESFEWFNKDHDDFIEICKDADVDINYALELADKAKTKELKIPTWRKIRNIWRNNPEKDRARADGSIKKVPRTSTKQMNRDVGKILGITKVVGLVTAASELGLETKVIGRNTYYFEEDASKIAEHIKKRGDKV